jgi:hypothetical protein
LLLNLRLRSCLNLLTSERKKKGNEARLLISGITTTHVNPVNNAGATALGSAILGNSHSIIQLLICDGVCGTAVDHINEAILRIAVKIEA